METLILKVHENHSFSEDDFDKLQPFLNKPLCLKDLFDLPVPVYLSDYREEGCLFVDHPYAY